MRKCKNKKCGGTLEKVIFPRLQTYVENEKGNLIGKFYDIFICPKCEDLTAMRNYLDEQ